MARVCTVMNVPRPERGYWAKLACGKTISKPALPKARPEDQLSWGRGADFSIIPRALPKPPQIVAEPPRRSTKKHSSQHPVVGGAKGLFLAGRVGNWSGYLKPAKKLLVDLAVSKTGLERALSFAEMLFWQMEDCGHRVVIAPEHERFRRADVDQHEVPLKNRVCDLWSPGRSTVVYIGTVAIGLTIIELSEIADAQSIDGGYIRLDPIVAQRMRERAPDSWRYIKRDFPSNRLCLQAYSPYWTAEWTKQWREDSGEDLKKRIPSIVNELIDAAPEIAKLVEEGERQAALERERREEEIRQRARERAEQSAADALKKSKEQLLKFIAGWAEAKRIYAFFAEVTADIAAADEETRQQLEHRLSLAKTIIGETDALQGLRHWKAPEELLAEDKGHGGYF
jgi:hypothetical protein